MDILIIDDEPLARERLARLLARIGGHQVVGEAGSGDEALTLLARLSPDVVLLDVRMPGRDGLSTARAIAALPQPPAVLFCTAYGDHAIEAFEASAQGYLLKPVSQEKLADALARCTRINRAQQATLNTTDAAPAGLRRHITAHTRRGMVVVPVEEIRAFMADHKYVTAYYPEGELVLDESLRQLEDAFGQRFQRVHRNALVALDHVERLEKLPSGEHRLQLRGVEIQPLVSRRLLAALRELLEKH